MPNNLRQVTVSVSPAVIDRARRELERKPVEDDGRKRSLASVMREWLTRGARLNAR